MPLEIYLDHSATTRVLPEVAEVMREVTEHTYANPSSLYDLGLQAEKVLLKAREQVSKAMGVSKTALLFTSGGTEANNLAVFGTARGMVRQGKHLVTSLMEHPSVLESFRALENEGFSVTYLKPDETGRLNLEELERAIQKDTTLVSIMAVNNETGVIFPTEEIAAVVHRANPNTRLHVDAVQAFGKMPISSITKCADLVSVSSHKIGGPKGAGALYVKEGVRIRPLLYGGQQEKGIRPGTENTICLAGFGKAAELSLERISKNREQVKALHDAFCQKVFSGLTEVIKNGEDTLPHVLNLSFLGVRSEVLLHTLESEGIYVSAGSACSSRKRSHSAVLTAMGLSEERLESGLRFSFGSGNTLEEVNTAAEVLIKHVPMLRRFKRK